MAWVKVCDSGLYTWDGSDSDFPIVKHSVGMPTYGFPLLPFLESPKPELEPLLGFSTFISYSPLREAAEWLGTSRKSRRRCMHRGWCDFIFFQRMVSATENRSRAWIAPGMPNKWYPEDRDVDYTLHNTCVRYRDHSWSVTVRKSSDHSGVRLPTDSVGVREMLRDREVNGTRRSPLLHWVTEHTRRNRINEEATHEVRAHLRGSRKCNWRGYLVEIRESELERENELVRKGLA